MIKLKTMLLTALVIPFLLSGTDELVRRRTARTACDRGEARKYLADPDPEIRRYALYQTTSKAPEKELPLLAKAVKDPSPLVRLTAVYSLSRLAGKSKDADRMLTVLMNDPDKSVRDAASLYGWPFKTNNIRLSEDPSWDYDVTTVKNIQIPDDKWKFTTDPKNRGHLQNYFAPGLKDSKWKKIRCGYWSDPWNRDYDGYAWYRIRFTLGKKPECNAVELRFTGVDESAWVWLNGVYLGSHDIGIPGYNKTFSLDCRKEIRFEKENLLVVRVLNREEGGGIWKPVFVDILK